MDDADEMGNTPTSVGKTYTEQDARALYEKHPHERGEDAIHHAKTCGTVETPPRAWGRLLNAYEMQGDIRNTPTSVGKTFPGRASGSAAWKHPHERGEDSSSRARPAFSAETPPRAWGRPGRRYPSFLDLGNTPTSVGKTAGETYVDMAKEKHPHERGED